MEIFADPGANSGATTGNQSAPRLGSARFCSSLSPALQLFSAWSERQAHLTRWVLLVGWLGLIGTLLIPGFDPWPFQIGGCGAITACHAHEGNHLFWGSVVPSALLVLVLLSHEFWRRVCPLAFVSQLFRALGRQRTVAGRGGRRRRQL